MRYTGFDKGGAVRHSWVHCDAQATDVIGRAGGTPIVSYGTTEMGGAVYLASPK